MIENNEASEGQKLPLYTEGKCPKCGFFYWIVTLKQDARTLSCKTCSTMITPTWRHLKVSAVFTPCGVCKRPVFPEIASQERGFEDVTFQLDQHGIVERHICAGADPRNPLAI